MNRKKIILSARLLLLLVFLVTSIGLNAQNLGITLSDEITSSGTEACVEVNVENFTNIRSLSLLVNTVGIASYSRVTNFNLDGLGPANFNVIPLFGTQMVWMAANPNVGVSIPDGTVIVEYCYDVMGNPGEMSEIFIPSTNMTFFETINGMGSFPDIDNGSISIPDMPLTIIENNIDGEDCILPSNGFIEITVEGGVQPYSFIWSDMNASTTEDLSGVPTGTYTVTVTDSATPPTQLTMTFVVPDETQEPDTDVGTNNTITCRDRIITLGGDGTSLGSQFEYQWIGPNGVQFVSGQNDPMAEVDQPGVYTFSVINTETNCQAEEDIEVIEDTNPPNLDAGMNQTLPCNDNGLILTAENDEGLSNLSAEWTAVTGEINEVIDDLSIRVLSAGTYSVILTNEANGCTSEDEIIISEAISPSIELEGEAPTLNCDLSVADITAIIPDQDVSIIWNTADGSIDSGENTSTVTISSAGTYIGELTDLNTNCVSTLEVEVLGNTTEPSVDAGEDLTFTCDQPIVTLAGSTDDGNASAEWTDGSGIVISNELNVDINRSGAYLLNITNEFGCLRTDEVMVIADTMSPIANAGSDIEVGCIDANGIQLDGSDSDIGAAFSYMWSTIDGNLVSGFSDLMPTIGSAGRYDLIVTNNDNGCTSLSSVLVNLQADLPLANGGADFSTCENMAALSGNLTDMVTGMWTTTSSANIDNPNNADISISNLSQGVNAFIWTLSTADCTGFSRDTVRVILEGMPTAVQDGQSIPLEENTISFDVTANDNTSNNDGVEVTFQTSDPNFMDLGNGGFSYTFPSDTSSNFVFTYTICSEVCPDLCDEAEVILNRIEPALEPVELDGLPNVITPNGDGLNDALVFDIMLTNPQDFPNPELVVFNRWGDIVYQQQPYDNNWQGTNQSGGELPEGTYYFINRLSLANTDILTGDITIIRD